MRVRDVKPDLVLIALVRFIVRITEKFKEEKNLGEANSARRFDSIGVF